MTNSRHPPEQGHGPSAGVSDRLNEIPAWSDLPRDPEQSASARTEIEQANAAIAACTLDEIVDGIQQFLHQVEEQDWGYDVAAMSKLFVLNRAVFDVPDAVPIDAPRFGGFMQIPVVDGRRAELWPWTRSTHGIRLTGLFGGFMGESYGALSEFENFRALYPIRPWAEIGS